PANEERKTTPKKFKTKKTPRMNKGAGTYPNYWEQKDRSGNHIGMDASKGNEAVYVQHRSGTAIEMHPDGALYITAHNSKYEITFGENRMTISGAQDISVKGDASLRVFGDYNVTCHKNYNLTVLGDYNIVAKNKNTHVRGNIDTQGKNINTKIEGDINQFSLGSTYVGAEGNAGFISRRGVAYHAGGLGAHYAVASEDGGDMSHAVQGPGNIYLKNTNGEQHVKLTKKSGGLSAASSDSTHKFLFDKDGIHYETSKNHTTKTDGDTSNTTEGDFTVKSKTGNIQHKAEQGDMSYNATQGKVEIKADQSDLQCKAGGDASFEGSTTHVSGQQDVHVMSSSGSVNVDPGGGNVNLAGGLSQMFGGLGQLSFLFNDPTQAQDVGDRTPKKSEKAKEEQDDTQTIASWDDPQETSGLDSSSGTLPNA
ncbi:hypothetical protein EB001_19420, partial [bacterium]|nr:hypothetical protein [bacterium]